VECRRDSLIDDLVKYAATDLLCYRAAVPEALARKQEQVWQPLLDWLHHHHGVTLKVTTGIIHIEQDQVALAQTGKLLHGLDSFRLMAFYTIATLCGSVAVALNVIGGNITAEQAWAAAQLDENYQTDQWGRDDEARTRQDNIRTELDAAIRFLSLL
ncbi:MAG: ATPase, partial [Alphaproteobacteria bacterium]|nr:ATPase [Alphaproteobacteria bacterium]